LSVFGRYHTNHIISTNIQFIDCLSNWFSDLASLGAYRLGKEGVQGEEGVKSLSLTLSERGWWASSSLKLAPERVDSRLSGKIAEVWARGCVPDPSAGIRLTQLEE